MNKLLIVLFLFLPMLAMASKGEPKPEKIYSITRVVKPLAYYQEQANLWNQLIEKDQTNKDAWLNYYAAARMANIRTLTGAEPFDLNAVVDQLSKAIPQSFEYHLVQAWHGEYTDATKKHAERAYELQPDRYESYPHLLVYYELENNAEGTAEILQQWFDSGEYSAGILSWNYNVLMSLEENAILITSGDNDTYPVWMLQAVQNIRPDVQVFNLNLLARRLDYRKRIFAENNMPEFNRQLEEYPKAEFFFHALTKHLIEQAQKPVYMGVATSRMIRELYSDDLYMVGLAFKYSPQAFDNVAVLKHNYEHKFLTDYLRINLQNDISASVVNQMNLNYIPPFIILHKHYKTSGDIRKAESLKKLTLNVARNGKQEDKVRAYLGEEAGDQQQIESSIPIKKLDKIMRKIGGNLYAAETELTNEAYELFLIDLVKNKAFDQLMQCKPEKVDWRELINQRFQNTPKTAVFLTTADSGDYQQTISNFNGISDEKLFENGNPDDGRMPVQNISYEAATIYCQWITAIYNRSKSTKKKFKKVLFRLPTEVEWEIAARGGRTESPYPWGGYYYKNAKGCYLSNFDVTKMAPCKDCKYKSVANDGGFFTVPADAYFPNDFGLYGASGNVAEMVERKGIAKGGSWEDDPIECQISKRKSYDGPSPAIGFRVFMDVIEE